MISSSFYQDIKNEMFLLIMPMILPTRSLNHWITVGLLGSKCGPRIWDLVDVLLSYSQGLRDTRPSLSSWLYLVVALNCDWEVPISPPFLHSYPFLSRTLDKRCGSFLIWWPVLGTSLQDPVMGSVILWSPFKMPSKCTLSPLQNLK